MKTKCNACGKRFLPTKENTYTVVDPVPVFGSFTKIGKTYDAIDCPRCGVQKLIGIRLPLFDEGRNEDETESDA